MSDDEIRCPFCTVPLVDRRRFLRHAWDLHRTPVVLTGLFTVVFLAAIITWLVNPT